MRPSFLGAISASGSVASDAELPEGLEWSAADAATSAFYGATTPPALYDSVGNTSWRVHEAWNGSNRLVVVHTYNHTTGAWAGPYTAFTNPLTDDDHGAPSIAMDSNGYVVVLGGSHNDTSCLLAVTTAPRDPSAWSSTINLATGTYPHPYFVGGAWHVFIRDGANNNKLLLRKSTSIASGVPTFGGNVEIGNFGADTRWYQGNGYVSGTDIHMLATRANGADTVRQDVYYLIYDTVTGAVRNFDGSVSVASGSLPLDLTTLNASYRIVDQTTGGTSGNISNVLKTDDGVTHITYVDGTGTDNKLYHKSNAGAGWGSALEIGAFATNDALHRYDAQTLTKSAISGDVDIWWVAVSGSFTRGGKIVKRTRAANGTLSAQADVKTPDRTYALDPVVAVLNGHADMRVVFAERWYTASEEKQLRVYAAGDSGIVQRPIAAPASISLDFTSETYNGATFVVVRDQSVSSFASKLDGSWSTFTSNTLRRTDKGLLVEPAATNLLQRARTLSGTGWTATGVVVTADQAADADGLTELELVNKNNSSTSRRVDQTITGAINTTYTFSVNAKAGTFGTVSLRAVLGASVCIKQFNLTTGAVTDVTGGPLATGFVSASAEDLSGGIWRLHLASTSPATNTSHTWGVAPGDNGVTTTGTVYAGSAQVTVGTTPSSLIPGVSAGAVRPADEIYFGVPAGVTTLTYTFDDNSTQQDTVVNHGAYKIPTNLNRRVIKTIVGS